MRRCKWCRRWRRRRNVQWSSWGWVCEPNEGCVRGNRKESQ